ncbi:iqgap-related protein [Savitreella phatthalungensis]
MATTINNRPGRPSSRHLKTLSVLGVDLAGDVDSLEIKDLLAQADGEGGPDVTGLNGRIRLQRSSPIVKQGSIGHSWMDTQRANIQAYEYLCRVSEAKSWLESCLGHPVPSVVDLEEDLRNGIVLAKLARVFAPDLVPRIFEAPKLQFRHSDNINHFFKFVDRINIPRNFRFELTDLYDKKNIPRVIYCIHALSYMLAKDGVAARIADLSGQVEFTEEQLQKTQRNLESGSGVLPNFAKMASVLGGEDKRPSPRSSVEEPLKKTVMAKVHTKSIPAKPSQQNRDATILQARARGFLARRKYLDSADTYYEIERWTTLVQRKSRGFLVRHTNALANEKEKRVNDLCEPLQRLCRGHLARKEHDGTIGKLHGLSKNVTELNAVAKGHLARSSTSAKVAHIREADGPIESLQAAIRGSTVRKDLKNLKSDLADAADSVRDVQTLGRGHLAREAVTRRSSEFAAVHNDIVAVQALARACLMRCKCLGLRMTLDHEEKSIVALQSRARAALVRMRFIGVFRKLLQAEPNIEHLQAYARGALVRHKHRSMLRYYWRNEELVTRAQAIVRARQQGAAYRSLMYDPTPPLSTIRNFLHLLDDSEKDFEEELSIEELRRAIIAQVRDNEHYEEHVEQMDIKIALLVKQAIKIDEVIQHQRSLSRRTPAPSLARGASTSSTAQFDLRALNRNARHMVECYQKLFYILQTQPVYLARLFSVAHQVLKDDREQRQMDGCVMVLFGYAQKQREAYYLLKLLRSSVLMEIAQTGGRFEIGNTSNAPFWERIYTVYLRGIQPGKLLAEALGTVVNEILEDDFLDLETDPALIYKSITVDEELRTGHVSGRMRDIAADEAIRDPDTRVLFIKHLRDLRDLTKQVLSALEAHIEAVPFSIRYLAREAFRALEECSQAPRTTNLIDAVGSIVFAQLVLPVLRQPDHHGLVDTSCGLAQRKNLADLCRMLEQVFAGRIFDEGSFHAPLNEFIDSVFPRVEALFERMVDVGDAETYFGIDPLEDVVATRKPTLYVKTTDLFFLHHILHSQLATIAPDSDDPVHEILTQMGEPPSREEDMSLKSLSTSEVSLTLDPRAIDIEDPEADEQALFLQTKRMVLNVVRIQPGTSLLDILVTPPGEEDELAWDRLVMYERQQQEHQQQQPGGRSASPTRMSRQQSRLRDLTFGELKRDTLHNILRLEELQWISRENGYQEVVTAIATDIKSQNRRRVDRRTELNNVRSSLSDLQAKHSYLQQQLQSYNDYIAHAMIALQTKEHGGGLNGSGSPGKRLNKVVIPFTKQYFHLKRLEKAGELPKFGSRRYAASKLHSRGVLVDIVLADGLSAGPAFDRFDVAVSSDAVGVFSVAVCQAGLRASAISSGIGVLAGTSTQGDIIVTDNNVRLDQLLQAQFDRKDNLQLCNGQLTIKVNLFIDMLFKHFFQ